MSSGKQEKIQSKKLLIYEAELRRGRIRTLIIAIVVFLGTAFFIMLVSGNLFNPVLRLFGLKGINNQEGGVYTDCSLEENQNVSYCQSNDSSKKNWDNLKQGGNNPFTLNGN